MRSPFLFLCAALSGLGAGCVDYGKLQQGFCDTAGVSLCDDFESGEASPPWSTMATGGGTATVVRPSGGLKALRGSQILLATAPAGARAMLEDSTTTPSLDAGDLYVRTYVFIVDASPSGPVELVSVRDPAGAPIISLQYENALTRLSVPGGRDVTFALTLTGDHWFCFEMALRRDASSVPSLASAEFYVDDSPKTPGPPALQLGDIALSTYGSTRLGVDRSGVVDGAPTTIAFDEVIINRSRITCAK